MIGRRLLDGQSGLLESDCELVDVPTAEDVVDGGARRRPRFGDVLNEVAEGALAFDATRRRRIQPGENLEEAGLAGTVLPDQADLVALGDREVRAAHEDAATHLHVDGPGSEHSVPWCQPRAGSPPIILRD